MATFRQSLVSTLLRRYPFYSGCGTLANHPITQRLAGFSKDQVWTSVPGGDILVSLDDYVGRAAYYVGDLDRKITWICQKLVGPGDTVMDIGANIGLVTLWLSYLVGESGKVHAFEPNPKLQEMIEKALHRNRRSNVIVHRMALGSKDGTMELYIPQGNSGEGSLIRNRARKDCNIVSVPVYTLSSVMAKEKFDKVRLIKIDVEGFEEEVLRGASEFFEKVRPETLLFEQNAKFNGPISHQPVIRLMHDLDYGFFSIQKCKLRMHLRRFYPDRDKRNNGNDLLAAHRSIYESIASLVGAQE